MCELWNDWRQVTYLGIDRFDMNIVGAHHARAVKIVAPLGIAQVRRHGHAALFDNNGWLFRGLGRLDRCIEAPSRWFLRPSLAAEEAFDAARVLL
jgi:hypothetical protein